MTKWKLSRRSFLEGTAAVAVGGATFGRARGAYAAGRLSVGFWDHWVPGANDYLTKLCKEWAEKEKVDLQIDYITSQGNKDLLTIAAEAQARSGHDILHLPDLGGQQPRRGPRAGRRRDEGGLAKQRQDRPRRRVPAQARTATGSPCRRHRLADQGARARAST